MEATGRCTSCDSWRDGGGLVQEEKGIRNEPSEGSEVKRNSMFAMHRGGSIEGLCQQGGKSTNPAFWHRSGSLVPVSSWAQGLGEC